MKKLLVLCILMICLVVVGCQQEIVITTGFEEGDLLKISGEEVKLNESVIILLSEKAGYDIGLDEQFWTIEYNDKTMLEYFKEEINEQIIRVNVLSEFAKEKNVSLTQEEQELIENASKLFMEKANQDVLKKYKITQKEVSSLMEKIILSEKVYEKVINDYEIEVSDEEARVMYVNYILIDAKAEKATDIAGEILNKVTSGNDLKTISEKYSYASYQEGYISRMNFDEENSEIIFKLKDGEISSVIEYNGKLYIIKCINDYDENMTNSNKEVLIAHKKEEEFNKEYRPFEKSVNVEFNSDLWNELKITDSKVTLGVNIYDILEEAAQE